MRPAAAQVAQDVGVGAAGLLQGVGQDGQAVEGPLLVDRRGEFGDRAALSRQPGGARGERPEGVADDAAEQAGLGLFLGGPDRVGGGRQPLGVPPLGQVHRVVAAVDSRGGRVVIDGWRTTLPLTPVEAARAF